MAALAALFLAVSASPASVLRTTVRAAVFEEFTADSENIVSGWFEPGIEFPGITGEGFAIPDDFFAPLPPGAPVKNAVSAAALEIGVALEAESPLLSIIGRLAGLSINPGVWLAAFTPGVWSVLTWQVRRPRRRRSRRHQY